MADVPGRMNREPNPAPGERPGYTPQYFDNNGYAVNVTPDTPYPTMDSGAVEELQTLKQKQADIDNKIQQLVEGQGNVEFPDVQSVKDVDVLSAIETLKQENAEIKHSVAEILDRLDGTFDTQLTGSNVVLGIKYNFNIPAGSEIVVMERNESQANFGLKEIEVNLVNTEETPVRIRLRHFADDLEGEFYYAMVKDDHAIYQGSSSRESVRTRLHGTSYRLSIVNESETETMIDAVQSRGFYNES